MSDSGMGLEPFQINGVFDVLVSRERGEVISVRSAMQPDEQTIGSWNPIRYSSTPD